MSCVDHCYILGGHVVGEPYCDRYLPPAEPTSINLIPEGETNA